MANSNIDLAKHPRIVFNKFSLVGLVLILIGIVFGIFMLMIELITGAGSGYIGIIIVPVVLLIIAGGILFPYGILQERKRRKAGLEPSISAEFIARYPVVVVLVGGSLLAIFVIVMGVASYQGYHWAESPEFCGQLCHVPMEPEWTTYQQSAHARVACVECHIGSGAEWFVRSKLSGTRQILAVMFNSFDRPIKTPIHNLRPARETCERCHWPQKFSGYKEFVRSYFLADEKNSPFKIRMMLRVGGEKHAKDKSEGIHYHMLMNTKVQYIARDYKRQEIAWVSSTHKDGKVTVYNYKDQPVTEEEMNTLEKRTMDCMDCHNRPAHKYRAPMVMVNESINGGLISKDIPFIKVQAVNALDTEYKTTEDAMEGIKKSILGYYKKEYPNIVATKGKELENSIAEVRNIYKMTIFPSMNANWKSYPDNLSHRDWPGCFRCHNDQMVSDEGKTIFTTCDTCHVILAQGEDINNVKNTDFKNGIAYIHPGDSEPVKEFRYCPDCHDGGKAVYE